MRHNRPWIALALLTIVGCAGRAGPELSPGPASVQQQRAQRFDPYPDNDVGPAIPDGRPRDYQKPLPEPARARWTKWGLPRFGS